MKKLLLVLILLQSSLYGVQEIGDYKAIFHLDSALIGDILIPIDVASEFQGLTLVDRELERKPKQGHWNFLDPECTGEMAIEFQADNSEIAFNFFKQMCEHREIKARWVTSATLSENKSPGCQQLFSFNQKTGKFTRNQ